jgi:hypothetical protein
MSVRIELNHAGVTSLLKSPEVLADMKRRANAVAATANASSPGAIFTADSDLGRARARASVFTENTAAMHAEATDRALTRAIDAGRP